MLVLTNTLTGRKEAFKPINPNKIYMYVCGITPYDNAHIGHGRCNVSFDILYRLLKFLGYDVKYCRNLTDIDDKILNKAQELFGDRMRYQDVTLPVIASFHDDVKQLNCLEPDYEPKVTENIDEIIDFIINLIKVGKAYESNGDVYFSIKSFPQYGKLSKRKLDDLIAGARVDISEKKENPLDFALWKKDEEGKFWQSPWGHGRPGWHIECSALARKYLAETIDIHAGGLDLIFPHHENEIAQTEALTNKPFAHYWLHNGFVMVDQEKMSKSLGNFLTLHDIFKLYDPMVVRFYFVNHQYKAPLDFSKNALGTMLKSYQRLIRLFNTTPCDDVPELSYNSVRSDIAKKMLEYLLDDLNTPGMLGVLFENIDTLKNDKESMCEVKQLLTKVLGLTLAPLPAAECTLTPEIEALIQERENARLQKNWSKADELRAKLQELGYEVQDKKAIK